MMTIDVAAPRPEELRASVGIIKCPDDEEESIDRYKHDI